MKAVNIREAKAQLSRLVDEAARGEPFVITKAGKPMVKVKALSTPETSAHKRLGFLVGQFQVPDDFDSMGRVEIAGKFGDISSGS